MPGYFGGLDLSPIVVIIAAEFVQQVLITAVIRAVTPAAPVYGS